MNTKSNPQDSTPLPTDRPAAEMPTGIDRRSFLMRNAVIGAIAFQRYSDHLFLEEVLIYPEYQNQGFGTEIVQQLLAEAAKDGLPVRLQVLRENGARSLYDRLGFVQIGKTDTHLLMEKTV
jgi:ribosomal protein S18 acetylase RimI-like enzyme